jgi:mRNA interferase RelE/StbE
MKSLPLGIAAKIDTAVRALANEPRPRGCRQMIGYPNTYRLRVSDYRILYRIHDDILVILVVRVGHRREVYRHMG